MAGIKDSPVEVGFLSSVFYDVKLSKKNFEVILGTSKGWLPYYYMGCRAMIAGMNNYAPEIMTLTDQIDIGRRYRNIGKSLSGNDGRQRQIALH